MSSIRWAAVGTFVIMVIIIVVAGLYTGGIQELGHKILDFNEKTPQNDENVAFDDAQSYKNGIAPPELKKVEEKLNEN